MLRRIFPLVLLILLIIPTFSSLWRSGYFPMHDDMQAMRLLQMDKCVQDGQIPCRWVPDMGYGYGYPQFNFYSPLPYYTMEGFHLLGFGFLDAVKAGFIFSVIASAVGMYFLGSKLWGRTGGVISGLFYSYASYRAVDMYVRGAVGEFYALAMFPFVFLSVYKVIKSEKNSVLWLALSLAALFTSHNISTLIFAPFVALWVLYLLYIQNGKLSSPKNLLKIKSIFMGSVWGFALSAFFLLPAWTEKRFVHVETIIQGYFNYLAHFVSIKQILFSSYFNYGGSEAGSYDEMSLSVGLLLWLVPLLIIFSLAFLKKRKEAMTVGVVTFMGWLSLFMTHSKSTPIWEKIELLEYVQFPWRFLMFAIFTFSLASGALIVLIKGRINRVIAIVIVFGILFMFNSSYFQPKEWLEISDEDKFSDESWDKQLTISIFDYLPKSASAPPAEKAPEAPWFIEGNGEIVSGIRGTDHHEWSLEVAESGILRIPLYNFPNWQVSVDGEIVEIDSDNSLGLITIPVQIGYHEIDVQLVDTPVRKVGNYLTLFGLIAIPVYRSRAKKET